MTLKELRMWHWRGMLYRRKQAQFYANLPRQSERTKQHEEWANKQANFHLSAVQAFNDFVPGTAEQDCDEAEAKKEKKLCNG